MSLTILFVCTGNICRSPMAERMVLARLPSDAPVTLASAGTHAVVGYGMDPAAAKVLADFGGDPSGHVARQLAPEHLRAADLVLAAASAHRSHVMDVEPLALRRTFTIREFARLGGALPPPTTRTEAALRERIAEVAGQRGTLGPIARGQDEIADPYGAPMAVMQRCGREVSDAVDAVLRGLGLCS